MGEVFPRDVVKEKLFEMIQKRMFPKIVGFFTPQIIH